jgi:hypothetical protein
MNDKCLSKFRSITNINKGILRIQKESNELVFYLNAISFKPLINEL